jgi:hypothetical protein
MKWVHTIDSSGLDKLKATSSLNLMPCHWDVLGSGGSAPHISNVGIKLR